MDIKRTTVVAEIIRFAIVGIVATAVHYAAYYLLLPWLSHNAAFTLGYVVSFIINYLLTTAFTFRARRSVVNGIGFIASHAINYGLQILVLNIAISLGCPKIWAPVPVYCICIPVNFLLVRNVMKKWGKKPRC